MTRPLMIVTAAGIPTSLAWWSRLRVEGQAVVLDAIVGDDESSGDSLVVAEVRSEGEAQAMFRTINQRLRDGASKFDARDWPGLVRDASDESAEGAT